MKIFTYSASFLFCAILLAAPLSARAARLYIDTKHATVSVGGVALIPVLLDTEQAVLNVVEGTISLEGVGAVAEVQGLNTAGSVLTLWTRTPALSEVGTVVSFTGGATRGITGSDNIIFTLVLKGVRPGVVSFGPGHVAAYLHDGQGTRVPVQVTAGSIVVAAGGEGTVPEDAWKSLLAQDRTPPRPFEVVMGSNDAIFEGKTFVAFTTTDDGSGVAYYEVTEGALPPVRAGHEYVLQHQEATEEIVVKAYDYAGNARTAVWYPPVEQQRVLVVLGALLLLALGGFAFAQRRKIRRA